MGRKVKEELIKLYSVLIKAELKNSNLGGCLRVDSNDSWNPM